ncbi:biotin transporter BioY [Acaryochloris sp. IP29b_bin.148]|uniref:biotin transporter BioY n=1 Tax=Acaryochloris sp. IP29b_bin.148 TaxID=2969218 RepID=UPI002604FCB1|nr:biotin transporter BioY [Acaryochloris sp. IP29b_bin.148]
MLTTFDEFLWAIIGLLLTINGVFIEVAVPFPSDWPIDWNQLDLYSLGTTLQVGAVLLVSCLGGKNAGALSQIAYLVLGLSGVQVFSQGGGLSYVQEPTFGYLLGFLPGAWICGYLAFRKPRRLEILLLSCLCGLLAIHVVGVLYLTGLSLLQLSSLSWGASIWQYSILPLPGQLMVVFAATLMAFVLRLILFY